jgi:transposase
MNKKVKSKKVKNDRKEAAERKRLRRMETAKTQNARHIVESMISTGIRGDYRDYVLMVGDQLIDWRKTMNVQAEDGLPVRVEKPVLIHKSKLAKIIGVEAAKTFWHPTFGRLVDLPPGTKSKGENK